jgi:hypothetical protein
LYVVGNSLFDIDCEGCWRKAIVDHCKLVITVTKAERVTFARFADGAAIDEEVRMDVNNEPAILCQANSSAGRYE